MRVPRWCIFGFGQPPCVWRNLSEYRSCHGSCVPETDSRPRENTGRATPARAGNTVVQPHAFAAARSHPRLRGEHDSRGRTLGFDPESPPLARGTRCRRCRQIGADGITPACAGNTIQGVGLSGSTPNHPRLRGEHKKARHGLNIPPEPPPLVRETRSCWLVRAGTGGATPACAGNTLGKPHYSAVS